MMKLNRRAMIALAAAATAAMTPALAQETATAETAATGPGDSPGPATPARGAQSTLAPEALTTGAQPSTSDLMNWPNSAGVVFTPTAPSCSKLRCTSGLSSGGC